jgi:hypothetical protein
MSNPASSRNAELWPPVHGCWLLQDMEAPINAHLTFHLLLARDPQPPGTL